MKRISYNRANLESCVNAARKLAAAWGEPRYVFATALGYAIENREPASLYQRHLVVYPDGTITEEPKRE